MKNDWFRVLEGSINLPYDENLAYELEVFLKDFVYLRKEEDKIILRCLKNGKDYEIKIVGNSIITKYNYMKNKTKYFINGKLDIYSRHNNKLINDYELTNSNSICYNSNVKIKSLNLYNSLVEIIRRKAFYFTNIDYLYKKNSTDNFIDDGIDNFYSNISTYYDKTVATSDLNIKYIMPDVIVGSELNRNESGTISRENKVIQGFSCSNDFSLDDNSYPIALLSDNIALKYFDDEVEDININDYVNVKKIKIGF